MKEAIEQIKKELEEYIETRGIETGYYSSDIPLDLVLSVLDNQIVTTNN